MIILINFTYKNPKIKITNIYQIQDLKSIVLFTHSTLRTLKSNTKSLKFFFFIKLCICKYIYI